MIFEKFAASINERLLSSAQTAMMARMEALRQLQQSSFVLLINKVFRLRN